MGKGDGISLFFSSIEIVNARIGMEGDQRREGLTNRPEIMYQRVTVWLVIEGEMWLGDDSWESRRSRNGSPVRRLPV